MALGLINDTTLQNIANAIRLKLNTTNTYKPSEMASAIKSISGGGDYSGMKIIEYKLNCIYFDNTPIEYEKKEE